MNHIYKVIWNKAKHCYTVVSEIAKSHSDSTKRVRVGTTAALMAVAVLTGFAMPAQAAVSIGTDGTVKAEAADINALNNLLKNGVTKNKDGSVTVGGLTVKKNGEVSVNSPDVVYGKNAKIIWDSNNTMGQISIGNNATAITGRGGQERAFAYDGDVNHAAGAIAIGANTYARTGSIMIGSHVYKGNMGDVTGIDTDSFNTDSNGAYGFTVNSTTIGTNSFTRGNLATTIGDYNIQSGKSRGYGWNSLLYGAQNFGATVIGALNSNESQSAGSGMSGIANSIVGVANKVNSSNGTLVFGAGNEVTNSLTGIYGVDDTTSLRDATAAQNALKNAVAESDAGGAVLAIGGANKADWARKSQLIGVGNTLTGASSAVSEYNMINGYKNEVTNATHTSIIGSNNKAKNIQSTTVMGDNNDLTGNGNHVIGDNHKVTGKNNILIGNNKEQKTHSGSDSVIIGNNASAGNGSMAMGNEAHAGNTGIALGMKASAGDGQNLAIGYYANVSGATNSTALGYASKVEKRDILSSDGKDGVVSVGKSVGQSGEAGITRRIINVKAGVKDTDAVNVSQLKGVNAEALKHSTVTNGDANITVTEGFNKDGGKEYKVALNNDITLAGDDPDAFVSISGSKGTIWTSGSVTAGSVAVGTAKADGTTPFFVDSKGAFYAANGKLVVDKDGKVTATEGEIGNVVLKNGVLYKNTALRDGELYVGDADGNYSQITPKSAKLGQVTIDEKGNIAGANSIQTNALNAKYNLSVGTANENGTVPFFVNSNGAFYAANGKLVVDKDGKVTATEGEIGNVVLKNGVLYKNTALRDGELYVGDVDGNYSQITTKGAKLGKVTVAVDGKISGVAAGAITADSTDAVNGSQLHAVATEAGKHSKVVSGNNINVEETDVDGQKFYKVNMNKDIMLGDLTGKNVSISGTNGTIEATGAIATKDRVYADKGAKLADIDVTGDTISNGDAKLALNGAAGTAGMINGKGASVYMQDGYTVINSKVAFNQNGKISGVAAGAVTADSTDAVNGSQLHAVATEAAKHSKVVSGNNINVEETDVDGQKFYKVNMNKDIMLGDLTGKNVSISGTNGTIEATGAIATKDRVYADKGAKLADIDVTGNKISNGASSIVLDGSNVKVNDKVTIDQNGKISGVAAGEVSKTSTDAINGSQLNQTNENVAALDKRVTQNEADIAQNKADIAQNKADIAQNKADIATNKANIEKNANDIATNKQNIDKLNTRVDGVEKLAKQHTTVTAGDNIAVTETTNKDGGKEYKVALDKDIKLDSVTANTFTAGQTVMNNDGLKVGKDVSVTATAVTAGKTSISDEGVKVGDKTYISADGLNANDQKITNVKAGDISETSKDAVNGSQLYKTNQEVVNNTNRINKLGSRVNKVGAGAAALAALHPMDFDPDDKLTFSAGYGNYAGENAAAIGAYYRPDEKVMFSVAGTVGNGENMVNAGVSFALDRTNHVSNSRTALAREVIDLRGQLAVMGAKMAKMEKAFGMLDETKTKLFPDVPANHWAYEYIAKLAGNGYIEGYPDGNFGGDRLMTRYEFAAMLYRAIENGAALEEKIIKEFEPELGRIRVDRISGEDGDRDKIERVRVNDTKGERDHYGNKLAK